MPAHLSPPHHQSLAAGDAKKEPHLGPDSSRRTTSCFGFGFGLGGDHHHHPKKPGPSAAKLALASFLGVHYGRAPARLVWRDVKVGHQYFVDLMLGHVLLSAICNG